MSRDMIVRWIARRGGAPVLDHLVYAVPDLEAGIADIQRLLGATVSPGGRHERWGTRNALLGLGQGCYLEILAPDPEAPAPEGPRPLGLQGLTGPRLTAWCLAPPDLGAATAAAREAGYDPGEPFELTRHTPGGGLLTWRLAMPPGPPPGDGLLPFLIDWGRTPHPSASAASPVRLASLRGEHPQSARIRKVLDALDAQLPLKQGPAAALIAVLETPRGLVELR